MAVSAAPPVPAAAPVAAAPPLAAERHAVLRSNLALTAAVGLPPLAAAVCLSAVYTAVYSPLRAAAGRLATQPLDRRQPAFAAAGAAARRRVPLVALAAAVAPPRALSAAALAAGGLTAAAAAAGALWAICLGASPL